MLALNGFSVIETIFCLPEAAVRIGFRNLCYINHQYSRNGKPNHVDALRTERVAGPFPGSSEQEGGAAAAAAAFYWLFSPTRIFSSVLL